MMMISLGNFGVTKVAENSQQERGLCLETGDYTYVVEYKDNKKVVPGQAAFGEKRQ